MTDLTSAIPLRAVEPAERDLEAHLASLRRKLKRAAIRGGSIERIHTRIQAEEEVLRRLQLYREGTVRRMK
jgi:hypothetical protein